MAAAISSLAVYGSDSSEDESEKTVSDDINLHLKPIDKKAAENSVKSDMQVVAAPLVATKVSRSNCVL